MAMLEAADRRARRDRLRARHRRAARSSPSGVKELVGPEMGALVITHYQRILNYITPDFVHVFVDGRIVAEGGPELAHKLEAEGYEAFIPAGSGRRRVVMAITETEVVQGIGSDYEVKYGFSRPGGLLLQVRPRASRTSSSTRSRPTRTSPTGCGSSATRASTTSTRARCRPGAATSPGSTSTTSTTTSARPRSRRTPGRTCPPTSRTPGTSSGSRRRRRSTSPASAPSTSPRSSTTSSRRSSRTRACSSSTWTPRLREHEDIVREYFGDDHPAERQQVRGAQLGRLVGRLVHLRAAGREGRAAAPGLLPHQRGEHGPVRAHADHRRRGRLRALRRGLHGADLLVRLAALGGRRDHRQEGRALPLHDDPELVEQRLQPRHEARGRLRERDDGVGGRQPRLEADDEVPGHLADGRGRARRGALDRLRRRRASTRTRAASASTSRRTRPP